MPLSRKPGIDEFNGYAEKEEMTVIAASPDHSDSEPPANDTSERMSLWSDEDELLSFPPREERGGLRLCLMLVFAVLYLVHFVGSLVWSHRFRHRILHFKHVYPMRQITETQKLSEATGIIYGLALGYLSTIIPVVSLGITILVAHSLCGMFGVALGALAWHTDNGTDH